MNLAITYNIKRRFIYFKIVLALKRLNSAMRTTWLKKIVGFLLLCMAFSFSSLFAQDTISARDTVKEVDVTDSLRKVFNRSEPQPKPPSKVSFAILPTLSYNPSF